MTEETLFVEALEIRDPDERAAFLDRACADDATLRGRLDRLLERHEQAGTFLQSPAPKPIESEDPGAGERPGMVVGAYKLLEQIGEGGFGIVFMAEQTRPVRRLVAVKVLKPGMDTRQVVARFEAERQALALMDHPHIAKILDGGTTPSGRPYFVMDLVKGVPITRYCDEHHLSTRQRLELFLPVCQAVQHAHQKGIIHRDLKPSNVLIALNDGNPVPKVIDFGVAKAAGQPLTDKTLVTGFGAIVGTLEYMSPEQAEINQLDIDTRSDIYSLGVLLYELLAGSPPFSIKELEKAGMLEMLRVIREQEPSRPSAKLSTADGLPTLAANRSTEPAKLTKLVRGELDWIVMKALEKDRNRRYETANGFAMDVQRYLADEAVQACPPSAGYRLRKFARRNKGPVLAASLVILAIIGAGIGTTFGLIEAQKQREVTLLWRQAEAAREGEAKAKREAEDAREKLASVEYGRTMHVAYQEWRDNNVRAALALLDSTRTDFRGWEWHYVHRLCHSDILTIDTSDNDSDGHVDSASFSADTGRVVIACGNHKAKVFDARTGTALLVLKGHTENVESAAFSRDGSRIVTGSWDQTARVWNATTGEHVLTFKGHTGGVASASFSPDGSRVLTASKDQTARLWDAKTGDLLLTLKGHNNDVNSATFNSDGSRILTASYDGTAKLWNTITGAELRTIKAHTDNVTSASFNRDGSRIVTGSYDRTAKVWDANTGALLLTLRGHTDSVHAASFSPDGSRVLTGSWDKTARVWNATTGEHVQTLKGHTEGITSASFSQDGSRIVTGGGHSHLAKVWDTARATEYQLKKMDVRAYPWRSFSPDGSRFLARGSEGTVQVFDVKTEAEVLTLKGHTHAPFSASYSADGLRIVTGSYDQTAKVWDANTGAEVLTLKGHTNPITSVSFSLDGSRLLTGCGDGTAKVWDANTGAEVLTIRGHSFGIWSASFSADGSRVVTGGSDRTAKVWDAKTGAEILTLVGHTDFVTSASFSPDGSRVLTGSEDRTAKVWDAKTGTEVLTLREPYYALQWAKFSSDGWRVMTTGVMKDGDTVKVWDATPTSLASLRKEFQRAVTTTK
jgi:eukaryotic-like serine/threonine-protein kinase